MKYLNQLEYPHIPYPTDMGTPDSKFHDLSIKEAGCGLCSLAMMVDRLTTKSISLKRLISLSIKNKANMTPGTNLKILGPIVADLFDLEFSTTNSIRKVMKHLKNGGSVIANIGGDREGYTGVFSHGGHYVLLLDAIDSDTVCILDPSLKEGKFEEPGREGKVRVDGVFSYCTPETISIDVANRDPGFYLFSRKVPK